MQTSSAGSPKHGVLACVGVCRASFRDKKKRGFPPYQKGTDLGVLGSRRDLSIGGFEVARKRQTLPGSPAKHSNRRTRDFVLGLRALAGQYPGWMRASPRWKPPLAASPLLCKQLSTVNSCGDRGSLQAAGEKVFSVLWGLFSVAAPQRRCPRWEPRQSVISLSL